MRIDPDREQGRQLQRLQMSAIPYLHFDLDLGFIHDGIGMAVELVHQGHTVAIELDMNADIVIAGRDTHGAQVGKALNERLIWWGMGVLVAGRARAGVFNDREPREQAGKC